MAIAQPQAQKGALKFYQRGAWMDNVMGWAFVATVVLGTLAFDILPALPNFYLSFTHWTGLGTPSWIGLDNYYDLATDKSFVHSVTVTVIYVVGHIPLAMIAGLALAVLVNQRLKGMTLLRAIYYLPVISSIIAIVMVFKFLLAPRFGLINLALWRMFQINGPNWLGEDWSAMGAIILVSVYTSMGYNMVLFLAGLQNIPPHLYEAAKIDGASSWQRFRRITLPLLTPTTFFILVLAVIGSFNVFALVVAMTAGGPGRATEVVFFYLYDQAFNLLKFGWGSAIAVFMFVVVGLLTLLNWELSRRWVFYG